MRRTKIEAGRYKAGWMRLGAGGRKRGAAALVAGTHTVSQSQGWGVSSGVAGDGDGWGPADDRTADAPPIAFRRGGSLLPPWMAMARTSVIGVISR